MIRVSLWCCLALPGALLSSVQATTPAPAASQSTSVQATRAAADEQKTFYELGVLLNGGLDTFQLSEAEFNQVRAGLTDSYHQRTSSVDAQAYMPKVQALQQARALVVAQREKDAGQIYLDKAAAQPGAKRMPSGLLYVPIAKGTGATPTRADHVRVNYEGRLIDGTLFDSSKRRNQPAELSVAGVIPCWSEALELMKVGDKSKIVCPADLAYGDHGALPNIKPGATLEFDIELLDVLAPTVPNGTPQ